MDRKKEEKNYFGKGKIPPGQLVTGKFPEMTYGEVQSIPKEEWKLRAKGLVSEEVEWTWNEFLTLPQTKLRADFHCVTQWSRFDDVWEGVMFADLVKRIPLKPSARFVLQHAYGGYTTNLPLRWMIEEDVILAHTLNGKLLPPEHGGPVRVFTPRRYAWKGTKWIHILEFLAEDKPGFWERNGYSNSADPWKEERFR